MNDFFLQFISHVQAQTAPNIHDLQLPGSRFNDVPSVIVGIITWLGVLVGILAVVALIYSGIMYITAGGDTAKADTAKKNITWAVVGIVVVLLSVIIVRWVNSIVNGQGAG